MISVAYLAHSLSVSLGYLARPISTSSSWYILSSFPFTLCFLSTGSSLLLGIAPYTGSEWTTTAKKTGRRNVYSQFILLDLCLCCCSSLCAHKKTCGGGGKIGLIFFFACWWALSSLSTSIPFSLFVLLLPLFLLGRAMNSLKTATVNNNMRAEAESSSEWRRKLFCSEFVCHTLSTRPGENKA